MPWHECRNAFGIHLLAPFHGGGKQDKSRREIDFVVRREGGRVDLIECKINPDKLDPGAAEVFRRIYPDGNNTVAAPGVREPWRMRRHGLAFTVAPLPI